ncbi:MAG: serine/threonine-protein kinase [Hyphomicrobiaceae bacterium]
MTDSNALAVGTRLGEYVIESMLGSGGFGITYRALDTRLDTSVAIKEYFPANLAYRVGSTVAVRPDGIVGGYDWGMEKFLHEASALARLQHPNIVGVRRLFKANLTAYMVLDYIEGPNLKDWRRNHHNKPDQGELDQILIPLLNALELVHRKGLLHRDIAPKNVMIASTLMPILIDFGAARQLVAQHSQTFAALLTPGYAPFEQYVATSRNQGPWTDIYALSASIYEIVTGNLPPEAPERAVDDKCIPISELERGRYRAEFLSAIDYGLRPLPKDRPQSVADWRKAFVGAPKPVRQPVPAAVPATGRWWSGREKKN